MKTTNEEPLIQLLKEKDKTRQSIDNVLKSTEKAIEIIEEDFILFHIEELTFEDDSPRKEALENVLSSLRIDGVNFVYLLLGEKHSVSFYFGIVKDKKYRGELELDVDDIGKHILKSNLEGNFRGSKITQQKENKNDILSSIKKMKRFAKVDGVPSVNVDSEDFQGVDRLVDVMMGDEFGLMVLADPLKPNEMQEIENSLYSTYNKLSPLAKESVQDSEGETKTDGKAIGRNESSTDGTNEGSSETVNNSKSITKGTNKSREFADKVVTEWIEYIDEVLLKRVEYGRNKGLFNTAIYLFANEKGTLLKLGNTLSSLFSGTEDNKAPLKLNYITDDNEIQYIKNLQVPLLKNEFDENMLQAIRLFSKSSDKASSWLSTNELSVITALPLKEVVGLPLKEEVEFGLNIKKQKRDKEDNILLGNLVRSGSILDIEINIDSQS